MVGPCASCGNPTDPILNSSSMSVDEAAYLVSLAEFERWYERESPEDREARQARYAEECAARDAAFEAAIEPLTGDL